MSSVIDSVKDRYAAGAKQQEAALCCPVDYDPKYLKAIPAEVIERDYGCGDPSQYVKTGETVLDLGSGTGKICFIASQVVGESGKVIGVDMTDDMLQIANDSIEIVAKNIGYSNVEFRKGQIQDLKLNRQLLDNYLKENPVATEADLQKLEDWKAKVKQEKPLVEDDSVDVVVSNCVLNLVAESEKKQMIEEIHRVLKRGGRAVISDIVADEEIPEKLKNDEFLWSGCISGAFGEKDFLEAFEKAGFYGVEILKRDEKPWHVVDGIEFRSVTIQAYKGKEGPCFDHKDAVVYKGPFSSISDDDGHVYPRGERVAVCRKTFDILTKEPYAQHFYALKSYTEVKEEDAKAFPCTAKVLLRHPKETKGEDYNLTTYSEEGVCDPYSGCC